MRKTVKKIWNTLTTIVVAIVLILVVLLVGVRLVGLQPYVVTSGSMEPMYKTGSLIYVKEVDPAKLEVEDVITFKLSNSVVATHRIVEIVPDENAADVIRFRTKGDANDVVDGSLVGTEDVIGTPIFTVPYLGYFTAYIQQPPGLYIVITVGVIFVLLSFLMDILLDDKDKKKEEEKSETK